MSFEGFEQHLCPKGHYWTLDAIETMYDEEVPKCPICGLKSIWYNLVNQTNGSLDEVGNRIDGYIELEIKSTHSGVCSNCGEKHICERKYKIPKCL